MEGVSCVFHYETFDACHFNMKVIYKSNQASNLVYVIRYLVALIKLNCSIAQLLNCLTA